MQSAKNAYENTKAAAGKVVEKMPGSDRLPESVKPASGNASTAATSGSRSGYTTNSGSNTTQAGTSHHNQVFPQTLRGEAGDERNLRSGASHRKADTLVVDDRETLSGHREMKEPTNRRTEQITTEQPAHTTYHVENPTVKTKDTQVQELINPPIVVEKVHPSETHQKDTHIQRDVHQDHYQTRVQPIQDKTVLPTQTESRTLPTEYREESHHRNKDIDSQLASEQSQFQSTTTIHPTSQSTQQGAITAEEHRHHHVHEIVQPVLEREVIQPKVIHTTQSIHETVEREPTFHPKTVQPAMTLEEYQRSGGSLEGKAQTKGKSELFQGEPQVIENGGANVKYPNGYASAKTSTSTTRQQSGTHPAEADVYSRKSSSSSGGLGTTSSGTRTTEEHHPGLVERTKSMGEKIGEKVMEPFRGHEGTGTAGNTGSSSTTHGAGNTGSSGTSTTHGAGNTGSSGTTTTRQF